MEGFVAFALGFALLQATTYLWHERRHRRAWVRDVAYARTEADLDNGFRGDGTRADQAYVGRQRHPRAPLGVRAAALWSVGMGQMLIPGGAMALFGSMIYGVGLIGVPGCILAARIWAVGPALLRAEPSAVRRARSAARFARTLNVFVLLGAALLLFEPDFAMLAAGAALYAGVSLAHAQALDRAANSIEQLWVGRGYAAEDLSTLRAPPRTDARVWA